ncbi:hypothetical protein CORC01_04760 [Colletotrichum orchidophilum]|uniref:SMP-30/Gluconolactonase/LRE-like region domain-containing protein n=1 Tax=Colletotrichum orchidophilum TaxID=1209926 RepID=A0A1G4BEF1_9PEZI|nr:uncharacterized protein CORC01_04760 [Colletotrichum orchidophilum]OHE99859.1 hypothetical protein CORC01_04760 [Colletotrichum orchidophilum]
MAKLSMNSLVQAHRGISHYTSTPATSPTKPSSSSPEQMNDSSPANNLLTKRALGRSRFPKKSLAIVGDHMKHEEISCPDIAMGIGGVNYGVCVLFCAQGSIIHPSGLFKMPRTPPYATEPVVAAFHSRAFNSVNDAIISKDGRIWFTDRPYGYDQV